MFDFIITYWVELGFGLLVTFFTFLFKRIVRYWQTVVTMKDGVRALLKSRILDNYNLYESRGVITFYEKETLYSLYREYQLLGGNGMIAQIMDDIEKLSMISSPIQEEVSK